jgi:glycosyltransferase involved in cell wall biosynthesis
VPHLLHVFPSFETGGQQIRMVTLANRLAARAGAGFSHSVVALDGRTDCADLLAPGVPVRLVGGAGRGLRAAWSVIRGEAPDMLLTHNWGSMEWVAANRLTGVPHLHFEDGFGPDESGARQLRRRVLARRLLLSAAGSWTIVPSRTLEAIATGIWRLPRERVLRVPNGIDLARFQGAVDAPLVERLGIQPRDLVVGAVGTLRPEKNLTRLIRAVRRVSRALPVRLVIVGDGPERARLEAEAREQGIAGRTVFTGRLAQPERLVRRFDLFALSSDTEQMPYSLIEAMAAGRPAVATDVGDVAAMVAPENAAYVVKKDDFSGFCAALAELLERPVLRARLGAANRAKAEAEFGIDAMVATYERLLARPSAGPRPLGRPQLT